MTIGEMVKNYVIPFAIGGVCVYFGEKIIGHSDNVGGFELKDIKGNVYLIDTQAERKELAKELFEMYDLTTFQNQEYNNIQKKYQQFKTGGNIDDKTK